MFLEHLVLVLMSEAGIFSTVQLCNYRNMPQTEPSQTCGKGFSKTYTACMEGFKIHLWLGQRTQAQVINYWGAFLEHRLDEVLDLM